MMLRPILLTSMLALAACDPPPPAATLTEIPAAFAGQWELSAGDCEAGGGSEGIRVSATEVVLPDSRLDVQGVAPDGDMALRADGHFKSSIAEWDGSVRLELAERGAILNAVTGSTVKPRVKCP
jgi:hypothetical protein